MRTLDPGHRYALANLDGDGEGMLTFVKREGTLYPGNVGSHAGTTMQEVLRALIDRCRYVDRQRPCAENALVVADLRSALRTLELRAARIHGIAVDLPLDGIELLGTCATCGHVVCRCAESEGADANKERI